MLAVTLLNGHAIAAIHPFHLFSDFAVTVLRHHAASSMASAGTATTSCLRTSISRLPSFEQVFMLRAAVDELRTQRRFAASAELGAPGSLTHPISAAMWL